MKKANLKGNHNVENLIQLIQSASLDRLTILSTIANLKLETKIEEALVRGHWMAMALAAGPQIRITFKVHFMTETGAELSHKAFSCSPEKVSFEKASDFMKEFCNMTLGLVKKVLAEHGLKSVLSLPLITRGFDEVFFPDSSGILLTRDFWRIHFGSSSVVCSSHIEIMESSLDLSQIPTKVEPNTDSGDVEFL